MTAPRTLLLHRGKHRRDCHGHDDCGRPTEEAMVAADGVMTHQLLGLSNSHQCRHEGHENIAIDDGTPDQHLDRVHFKVAKSGKTFRPVWVKVVECLIACYW